MKFEEKWSFGLVNALKDDFDYIVYSKDELKIQKFVRKRLVDVNKRLGINYYLNGQMDNLKSRLSMSAQLAEYCFIHHNQIWPYWNPKPYTFALLSDNFELIDRYAHLPVDEHIIFDDPKKGRPVFWNYAIQGLLRDDDSLIQRSLDMIQVDIDKKVEIRWKRAYMACIEAVASKDNAAIEKALLLFEDKRIKKQAIKADICEEVLSFFPLAYAKIAWLKGIEVDPGSKYIPIYLLKVRPLEEYTIPYWFLRDFYREQSIDWRYNPIHPELQDWDNDPENPNNKKGGFLKKIFS